ncbi:putative F-box protein At1g49610 [Triticum dicoccoides]|uniref:putative F-box protein At1g49610 n=1 Tax=Triticum dicoccoides TaxID=85692 RepID=UPI001891A9B6|nr:putative F-box protein At1g49610 [Triticum dicoccoides]
MSTGDISGLEHVMDCCLPASPVSPAAHFSAATSSADGEDRISALPDTLLRSVVSRLPVKDAARTGALSHRWRGLWRATPLALDDAHLLPSPVPAATLVSRVLASHPGPFRAVRIAEIPINESNKEALLPEWLRHLADKGVENLTLVNRPYSFDDPVQLPATLLRCGASLRRLYLGVWLFPSTTDLPPGPDVFPNLQELGICHGTTEESDLDYVLACSPKLETLALISNYFYPDRVRIRSRSLRCLLLWHSLADEVAAVSAPNLQRLIIYCTHPTEDDRVIKVKIGHAPKLAVLGYLDTATHELEIGNTIIKAGVTKVCPTPNTVVPSVKVLALKVRFRVPKEIRTLLCFLRCFPGVETLHIMASDNDTDHYDDPGEFKPSDQLKSTFWQAVGPIKCVKSRVQKLVFDQFNGGTNQVEFLKLVLGRAVLLQKVIVLLAGLDSISTRGATSKLQPFASKKMWASKVWGGTSLVVHVRAAGQVWRYDEASDLSIGDPFIS